MLMLRSVRHPVLPCLSPPLRLVSWCRVRAVCAGRSWGGEGRGSPGAGFRSHARGGAPEGAMRCDFAWFGGKFSVSWSCAVQIVNNSGHEQFDRVRCEP